MYKTKIYLSKAYLNKVDFWQSCYRLFGLFASTHFQSSLLSNHVTMTCLKKVI